MPAQKKQRTGRTRQTVLRQLSPYQNIQPDLLQAKIRSNQKLIKKLERQAINLWIDDHKVSSELENQILYLKRITKYLKQMQHNRDQLDYDIDRAFQRR
jgi:hypothetical protein